MVLRVGKGVLFREVSSVQEREVPTKLFAACSYTTFEYNIQLECPHRERGSTHCIHYVIVVGQIPSDGVDKRFSEVPTAAILVVLVAVILSLAFALSIGIATVIYRNNK